MNLAVIIEPPQAGCCNWRQHVSAPLRVEYCPDAAPGLSVARGVTKKSEANGESETWAQ